MRRYRTRHYRLGDADVTGGKPLRLTPGARFEMEPMRSTQPVPQPLPSGGGGQFLTPQVGDTMIKVGAVTAIGVIGYYLYKGGSITELWSQLFPKEEVAAPQPRPAYTSPMWKPSAPQIKFVAPPPAVQLPNMTNTAFAPSAASSAFSRNY